MPRKITAPATPDESFIDHQQLQEDFSALNTLAVTKTQQDATVRAVAAQLGYQLPADCTDPDLIQRDIAANMRRSVEACLEVGRGLRVLKEACGHGNFMARLDVLGIETRVAQKFMAAAAKFSNATSTPLLKAAGNQTKLFEMLVLDDEQVEELELTGQTGELHLDDIATMSVKELRKALREARETADARERIIGDKDAMINRLTEEKTRRKGKTDDAARERADLEAHLLRNLQDKALTLLGTINEVAVAVADIEANEPTEAMTTAIEQTVTWLFQSIAKIAHERYLPVDFEAVVKGEFFEMMGFGDASAEAEGAEA